MHSEKPPRFECMYCSQKSIQEKGTKRARPPRQTQRRKGTFQRLDGLKMHLWNYHTDCIIETNHGPIGLVPCKKITLEFACPYRRTCGHAFPNYDQWFMHLRGNHQELLGKACAIEIDREDSWPTPNDNIWDIDEPTAPASPWRGIKGDKTFCEHQSFIDENESCSQSDMNEEFIAKGCWARAEPKGVGAPIYS